MQAPHHPDCAPEAPQSLSVVGLVLTLAGGGGLEPATRAALESLGGARLGEPRGNWLPLVCETGDQMALHRRLEALPGVVHVDVAFVELSDLSSGSRAGYAG